MSAQTEHIYDTYKRIQSQNPGCLILLKNGSFWEVYGPAASEVIAYRQIGNTHDVGDGHGGHVPEWGFSCTTDTAAPIIRDLMKHFQVRLAEPDPGNPAAYDVTAATPATYMPYNPDVFDSDSDVDPDDYDSNYLASVYVDTASSVSAVAFADFFGRHIYIESSSGPEYLGELMSHISTYRPTDILINVPTSVLSELSTLPGLFTLTDDRPDLFDSRTASRKVRQYFDICPPTLADPDSPKTMAFGGLATLVEQGFPQLKDGLRNIDVNGSDRYMHMDRNTIRQLDLLCNSDTGEVSGSLFGLLRHTKTAAGTRLLRYNIAYPSTDPALLRKRYDIISALNANPVVRSELSESLRCVHDISRIVGRLTYSKSTPSDLRLLMQTLGAVIDIRASLSLYSSGPLLGLRESLPDISDIYDMLNQYLLSNSYYNCDNVLRCGVDPQLDAIRDRINKLVDEANNIGLSIRQQYGITSAKVLWLNRNYVLEVSKKSQNDVPKNFSQVSATTGYVRYSSADLRYLSTMREQLFAQSHDLQLQLCTSLAHSLLPRVQKLQRLAGQLALLDLYQCLSYASDKLHLCRPELITDGSLYIHDGRHPVVEQFSSEPFVPNDTLFDSRTRAMVITGPNMSGKSTYMRQVAIITVMAQIGSFVPAASAKLPITDRILTRIGASDNLVAGQSTFSREMTETATILRNATENSLVLFDEIGRGTEPEAGQALARAIMEYAYSTGAKILFSTHYHSLIDTPDYLPGVKNFCVDAILSGGSIQFRRKVVPGFMTTSYGIEIAELCGLPSTVIERARRWLLSRETKMERDGEESPATNSGN